MFRENQRLTLFYGLIRHLISDCVPSRKSNGCNNSISVIPCLSGGPRTTSRRRAHPRLHFEKLAFFQLQNIAPLGVCDCGRCTGGYRFGSRERTSL